MKKTSRKPRVVSRRRRRMSAISTLPRRILSTARRHVLASNGASRRTLSTGHLPLAGRGVREWGRVLGRVCIGPAAMGVGVEGV